MGEINVNYVVRIILLLIFCVAIFIISYYEEFCWHIYSCLSGNHHCMRTQALPLTVEGTTVHAVRFNNRACNSNFTYVQSHPFCGGSGWGDEEATVVCRSLMWSQYGIGGGPMGCLL